LTAAIALTHSIRLLTTIGSVAFIQIALELHVWAVMHYTGPVQPVACGWSVAQDRMLCCLLTHRLPGQSWERTSKQFWKLMRCLHRHTLG